MQKIFTGLENAFAGPGWAWKPHKSKDHKFLHRNYIQKIFNSEKNMFFFSIKMFSFFFGKKKSRKMLPEKIQEFFDMSKISGFFRAKKNLIFLIEKKT